MKRMSDWLKDHCRWYRRLLGGRWAQWNGFWEQELGGALKFFRGFKGVDLVEGAEVWEYRQWLEWGDEAISAREDCTVGVRD